MDLRTGPSAVERGTRARSLRGKILARPPSPCPHDHDRLRIPPAPPTRTSGTEKKESTVHRLSRACRPYATPSSNSSFDLDFCDARTAEDKSAKSNGVNKSAKVVLGREPINLEASADVRFSNRLFGVKRFQTIHHCNVDVAHGLVLLFGIGTRALPSWDSRTRWNNLCGGLIVRLTIGPSGHANSPHPSSREGHPSTAGWNSSFLLSYLVTYASHDTAASRVHRNSVPSTHMRCIITASRRARATIAFFIPRRLAICMAQALSQDHFFERSMLCAAS